MTRVEKKTFSTSRVLVREAAESILQLIQSGLKTKKTVSIALSGGSTPAELYWHMGEKKFAERFPWKETHFFWGDERWAPPDDARSNYRMAKDALLSRVPIPESNIHAVNTCLANPAAAAKAYEEDLRAHFGKGVPRFDLVLLGLGLDGHVASLFPGNPVLAEKKRLAAALGDENAPEPRISLTFPVINNAHAVFILVAGTNKREIVSRVFRRKPLAEIVGRKKTQLLPAQMVKPKGRLVWFLDAKASHLLVKGRDVR